jgi:hypothetical protein
MSYEMKVTFKGDHVEAFSKGEKNYQTAERLWREIVRVCNDKDCYRVLGIADSDRQMSVMDAINHEQLFRSLGITPKYRIAWVELNEQELGRLRNLETILLNRGFAGKVFAVVEEAREWLLGDV